MLIFIVPTSYPNDENPVANSFVKEQALELNKIEHNTIVVLNVQKQPSKKIFKKISHEICLQDNDGVDVVSIKAKTFMESRFVLLNQLVFNKKMKKIYRYAVKAYGKPDLLYAHFYNAAYSAIKMVRKDNVPTVIMEHSGKLMEKHFDLRSKWILQYVLRHARSYIATTDNLQKNIIQKSGINAKINVIPNIVDSSFSYIPTIESNAFGFFSLARFEYDKRIDLLIEAFCDSFSENDNVFLRIGGDGKELEAITQLIADKKRENQIVLLGRLNRNQVIEEMGKCSCFVLPSRHETFGLVWREALCVGRPVITTDHGGFGETDWSDDYGIMIPVDSKTELSDALTSIRNNYSDYELDEISKVNAKKYSATAIIAHIMSVFNDCVTDR